MQFLYKQLHYFQKRGYHVCQRIADVWGLELK